LSKILSNSTVYPYSTVGLIKSNIDGQEVYGTGTIIGKKYVLTCAHNCYSIKNKKATETLLFYPGYTAQGNGPCYKPKVVHFPHSFQNSLEDDSGIEMTIANDYAVLELDTEDNLEAAYGSLGIDFTEDFSDLEKEIIGFSKRHHRHINLHCYKGEGHLDSGIIKYNMPASYGMSGAPIIEEREDQFYIIGLHVYCLEVGRSK
jgi:V8-like Glu-specific endopeptidase